MALRITKAFVFVSATLILITLVAFHFCNKYEKTYEYGTFSDQNSSIQRLLKVIDSSYWDNPHKSLDSLNILISLSEKANNNEALAMAYYYKAACYIILERYDSAYILCLNALSFAEKQNNDVVAGKMKIVLANYHIAKNEFKDANKCLLDALEIFERKDSVKDLMNVLNGFGLLYYNLKEFEKAITYYTRVIALSKGSEYKRQESVAYLNISNCYLYKLDYDRTIYFLDKALSGFRELNDSVYIMMCHMNLGIVSIDKGDEDKGLSYYFSVSDFSRRTDKKLLLAHTLFNIATVYYDNNNLGLAEKYYFESMEVYRSISNKSGEKDVLNQLSKIELSSNNWKQAYEYYDSYIVIKDSILNADLLKNINDLQWKYDFQKQENETQAIKKRFELKQKETAILIISFIFVFIVVLLFIAVIRLANKNLKKSDKLKELRIIHLQGQMIADEKINHLEKLKLRAEIEAKNKELTTTSLQLILKNDVLNNVSGIAENYFQKKSMNEECYNRLKIVLKENLDQDKDWEHFKNLFEGVHHDFFKNIKRNCPEITENELRLCAYLKINLHNKEIAKLLNITPDSLKTLRYRIRKKFHLEKDTILEDYIRDM